MIDNFACDSCSCEDENLLNDRPFLLNLLETMMLARKFEEKISEGFENGELHGTSHLGVGEEAAKIGLTAALRDEDYIFPTHRGHCEIIGKGCDINAMMAEMYGKTEGSCHGYGGSMHIADLDKGILGANGIVGANAPIACGAAMTIKRRRQNRVSVCFFGDGASNQGAVHEAMNLAAAWSLPVIFCLVNNKYALSTPIERAVGDADLVKRAQGYGMKAFECDGNDVLAVYDIAKKAREYTVNQGPVLIVEHTYRTSGHSKNDSGIYRSGEEVTAWEKRNPIARFEKFLLDNKLFNEYEIEASDKRTSDAIETSVELAKSYPEPDAGDVLRHVYA